jgi:hypothetical protein
MHAYKDAIRRTSGAYVLYPGEENRELRGFHEIIPGLGAFRIRPAYWQEDSMYLKQFLAEVKAHLLDRTSDREKLSYFDYKIHKDNKSSMVMESLPESEGRNRGFLPDETYVLLGYFRDKVHLKWIQDNHLTIAGLESEKEQLQYLLRLQPQNTFSFMIVMEMLTYTSCYREARWCMHTKT